MLIHERFLIENNGTPIGSHDFTTNPRVPHIRNRLFDEYLVTFAELGGELTSLEAARLKHFGYNCDPKKRLHELIGSHEE